jgi:uncharacterized protein YoxC
MADKRELLLIIKGRDQGTKKVLDDVADSAEGAEDDLSKMRKGLDALDAQMDTAARSAANLRKEIGRTGDLGLIKDLQKAERDLSRLGKQRKLLLGADDGAASAEQFSLGFAQRIGPLMARAPISPPLIGAVAAAAPFIASAISGAVTLGLGAGAVAAGVKIAASDPSVQAAGKAVGQEVAIGLSQAASEFVPETRKAISFLRREFQSLRPVLDDIFDDAADYLEPLTRGVAGFARNLTPGIRTAVRNAEPLVDIFAEHLPRFGSVASGVLEDLSSSAVQSANTISAILTATEASLATAGKIIELLAKGNHYLGSGPLKSFGDLVGGEESNEVALGWVDSMKQYAEAVAGVGVASETSAQKNQKLLDSIQALEDATSQGRQAVVDFEAGIDELNESVKENGKSLDVGSEKGRANIRVVNDLIAAATAAGKAEEEQALARGESAESAAAAGARLRQTWINDLVAAAEKAGLSKRQIEAMVAAARKADGERIRIYHDQIFRTFGKPFTGYTGIGGSTARGYSQGGMIEGPGPRGKDSVPIIGAPGEGVLNLKGMAAIGGEKALKALNRGGGGVREWMATAGSRYYGGGGGPVSVRLSVAPGMGSELERALMKSIRIEVAGKGSGSVQRAFG